MSSGDALAIRLGLSLVRDTLAPLDSLVKSCDLWRVVLSVERVALYLMTRTTIPHETRRVKSKVCDVAHTLIVMQVTP